MIAQGKNEKNVDLMKTGSAAELGASKTMF